MAKLVFIRHGQSEWNLENLFTGWVDVNLSEQGEREAKEAGHKLKEAGIEFDQAYTSVLTRTIKAMVLKGKSVNRPPQHANSLPLYI